MRRRHSYGLGMAPSPYLGLTVVRGGGGGGDTTAPTILLFAVGPQSGFNMPINVSVSDTSTPISLFVVGVTAGSAVPSAAQIIAGTNASTAAAPFVVTWTVSVSGSTSGSASGSPVTGSYDFYAVARDAANNVSAPVSDLGISYTAPVTSWVDTMDYASGVFLDQVPAYTSLYLSNTGDADRIQGDGTGQVAIPSPYLRSQFLKLNSALNADHYAEITYSEVPGNSGCEMAVRVIDYSNYYFVEMLSDAGKLQLKKKVAGSVTDADPAIGYGALGSAAVGDVIRLEMQGSTLRLYRNGSLLRTVTGLTQHTTGQVGFAISATSAPNDAKVTRFAAGNL